jgi:hypothetical protein
MFIILRRRLPSVQPTILTLQIRMRSQRVANY